MQNKNIIRIFQGTAFILLIPFIAMQFNTGVDWGLADFIIIGTLLIGTGLIYEFISRKIPDTKHRIILATTLILVMLVIWVDLAVGIFNIPGFSGS